LLRPSLIKRYRGFVRSFFPAWRGRWERPLYALAPLALRLHLRKSTSGVSWRWNGSLGGGGHRYFAASTSDGRLSPASHLLPGIRRCL